MRALTVLMSVYAGDCLENFLESVTSITSTQSIMPDQLVIVRDGPVTSDLQDVLNGYDSKGNCNGVEVCVLFLEKNVGLAAALNAGLAKCRGDWVVRMDSDDIAHPQRIEVTKNEIETCDDASVVGFSYQIFDTDHKVPYARRVCPARVDSTVVGRFFRTPINHPTIAVSASLFEEVRYPEDVGRFEDWGLILDAIKKGFVVKNVDIDVLMFRAPLALMARRGGWAYLLEEFAALTKMYRKNLIPLWALLLNLVIRTPSRITPSWLRHLMYRELIWKK